MVVPYFFLLRHSSSAARVSPSLCRVKSRAHRNRQPYVIIIHARLYVLNRRVTVSFRAATPVREGGDIFDFIFLSCRLFVFDQQVLHMVLSETTQVRDEVG